MSSNLMPGTYEDDGPPDDALMICPKCGRVMEIVDNGPCYKCVRELCGHVTDDPHWDYREYEPFGDEV